MVLLLTQTERTTIMEKTFIVAGVSTLNGKVKLRFANDLSRRERVLKHNGHDAIRLVELASAMTKAEAAKALAADERFGDVRDVIDAFVTKAD
jgi:hypothetical protein